MRRICGRWLAGTPIFHRFSKDNFQHESANLFFLRDSLIYDFECVKMGVCIVKRCIPWQSRAKKIIYPFFFFYFKRLPIYRINILKCTSLRNLYSKLSTSHQILKFNRRLQIIETQRFQFIISKHKEKKRGEGKGGRKGKNVSRRKFFQMKLITSCNGVLSPVIEWIPTYIIETMLLRDEGPN